jgi:6-pyruvoyltetrahydropterin/6-carboxytetrahydropterin synthase
LNCQDDFTRQVPTTENLCIVIYNLLAGRLSGVRLERVGIEETSNNSFEYAGKEQNGSTRNR